MVRVEEKLAVQIGGRGYYGKVTIEFSAEDCDGKFVVEYDPAVSQDWRKGVASGIAYALEQVTGQGSVPSSGRVRVLSVHGMIVDTTEVVMAYVAATALFKALGVDSVKKPEFDKKTGIFSFPNRA